MKSFELFFFKLQLNYSIQFCGNYVCLIILHGFLQFFSRFLFK